MQDQETRRVSSFGPVREPEPQEVLEPGTYKVEMTDVTLVKNRFYDPNDTENGGTEYQWQFDGEVREGDDELDGTRLRVWAPDRGYISSRSKAGGIIEACLGRALSPGENVGPADVLGRIAEWTVKTEKRTDGSEFNKVTAVSPTRRRGRREVQAASDGIDDIPM